MPAQLPGSTSVENAANPSAGAFVIFDPLSGPKGSPLDNGAGTGAMSTGIGISAQNIINIKNPTLTAPQKITGAGFTDDQTPGTTRTGFGTLNAVNSTFMYIGGGRVVASTAKPGIPFTPSPYTAGIAICGAGNGASRDGGAGPAFTGFSLKMVTAAGAVNNGVVVETGFINRSGVPLVTGDSVHGSASATLGAAS